MSDYQPLDFEKPIIELEEKIETLKKELGDQNIDMSPELTAMVGKLKKTKDEIYNTLSAWDRVKIARHVQRPFMLDYLKNIAEDFTELHGDRIIGDDNAMPGGFATIGGIKCVVIGHQKGRDTKENLKRNFGSAHPEGYRKALRLMQMAEKFNLPLITFIDTPGAFPGIGAEERNISEAIARNLRDMMVLKVPVVAVVLGEGGSGGALGIGIADTLLMMENSYYSVISPEGCAAILYKHRKHAPQAAEAMKMSAPDLEKLGVIDGVVKEPRGGAHRDPETTYASLKEALTVEISKLQELDVEELLDSRYNKFRNYGVFAEG